MKLLHRFQLGVAIALLAISAVVVLRTPDRLGAQTVTLPTIQSVTPPQGTSIGGTLVTITGTDFRPGASVFIGGRAAGNVVVVSSTQITAVTPQAANTLGGSANVTVQNTDGGVITSNGGYFYLAYENPLSIIGIEPAIGPNSGGTTVTLTGTGFNGAAAVYFNGVPASFINPLGASSMFVRTPANVTGPVTVMVVNPDGTTATRPNGFTFTGGVSVSRTVPAAGPVAGGTSFTVFGDGFRPGARVKLGDAEATSVVYVNSTQLVAKSPAGVVGSVSVSVVNPGGEVGTGASFAYGPAAGIALPVIVSVFPATGQTTGGQQVSLNGTGFLGGAAVYFGSVPAASVSFNGASSLFVRTPPQVAGPTSVTIVNGDGGTMTLPNAFTFEGGDPVQIVTVSPVTGPAAGGTVVNVTGSGFSSGSWVTFNGIPAASSTVVGSTQVVATTPAGLSGPVTIAVTQVGGLTASRVNGFTFTGGSGTTPPPAATPTPVAPPVTTPPVTTPPASGGAGAFLQAPLFSASGQALVIFSGGSVDQLEGAASGAKATGAWLQDSTGGYQLLVVGGPAFLKEQFRAKFPNGLTGFTPATLTR